jgi:hypothetical protein
MRLPALLLVAAAAAALPHQVAAQSASTTRIETRPFYGATVTLEEGVRVFRPLPSHDRVIINPGGATPLHLSFEEKRHETHNYGSAPSYAPHGGYGASGVLPYGGGRHIGHRSAEPRRSDAFGGGRSSHGRR